MMMRMMRMSDRKPEVFIIEDIETGLIDGYHFDNVMALQHAIRYAEITGHSMEVKTIENFGWIRRKKGGKLTTLVDLELIKCSEAYLKALGEKA